jgi:rubrerythrin
VVNAVAKYIELEDAYRTLSNYYHHSTYAQSIALREALDRVPAADVVERKTGKWLKSAWSIRCSECGYDMPFAVRNFCPNCGAKMEVPTDV